MELEQELADLEACDRDLAKRDPSRLIYFLLGVEHFAWSNHLPKVTLACSDPSIKFKVEGRRVYREIHNCGSSYNEEHLATPLRDIPSYHLRIRENVEKVPS